MDHQISKIVSVYPAKAARLISITKEGTRSMCQIDPDGIISMRSYLNQFWDTALAAFKSAAEKEQRHES